MINKIIQFFKRFFGKSAKAVIQSIPVFRLEIGDLISVCPGGRHAWYQSNVGKIRKPYKLI